MSLGVEGTLLEQDKQYTMLPTWLPPDLVLLVITILSLGYLYLTWTYDYWKKRGVPQLKPQLFFGNFKDATFIRKTVGHVYEEVYRKLDGHHFGGFYRFREPVLLIRDPELIKSVLVKEFSSFYKNGIVINEELDPILAKNPFFLSGERWKRVRSQLTPAFTSGKIKSLFPFMEEVCHELVEYLEETAPSSGPDGIEAKELTGKYTADVVASCAFGIRGNSFKDPNAEIRAKGKTILEAGFWKNILFLISFLFPKLSSLLRVRFMSTDTSNFFRKIINEVVSHRENTGVERNDFLQQLLQMKYKATEKKITNEHNDVKDEYTNEDITAHAITFFTDGFETSAVIFSFILYELAMNPDVQEKLHAEVQDVLSKTNGVLNYDTIHQMTYLEKVCQESLRMHTPLMSMEKICTKSFEIQNTSGSKCIIEPGTMIVIPVMALHNDPKYYPNPKEFDPERFSEDAKKDRNRYVYLAFGEGPRMCLGMRFAQAQIKTAIVYLVQNFEIKKTRKTPNPVIQDPSVFFPAAKGGLWLDFVKRKS